MSSGRRFNRKEINLLMSTSYGPGRYDPVYEEDGQDYPFAHVRWTLNRNMQAYLDLIAAKRLNVETLLDRIVPIEEAPAVYHELANGEWTTAARGTVSVPRRFPASTRSGQLQSHHSPRTQARSVRPHPLCPGRCGCVRHVHAGASDGEAERSVFPSRRGQPERCPGW